MCNYYAFDWNYGVGAYREYGDGRRCPDGQLMVFDSERERDAWVAADVFDGNLHRRAMDGKTAKHIMVWELWYWGIKPISDRYESFSTVLRYAPIKDIVRSWRELQDELYPSEE